MKSLTSKLLTLTLFASLFGGAIHLANAQIATPSTETSVSNFGPTITVTPSDGGSATGSGVGDTSGNPTNDGSNVTFTVTATDVNSDEYFLAVCSTDAVTAGTEESDPNPPTCATDDEWEISAATSSDAQATATYTTGGNTTAEGTGAECTSAEECQWFAFICEDIVNTNSPICFPTSGDFSSPLGDQGRALGTITISDVPDDQTIITIDTKTYEFDNGGSCGAVDVCINTVTFLDGQDAASSLVTNEPVGVTTSNMFDRGTKVYVYATAAGTGGNAIALVLAADTGGVVEIVGDATVSFGSASGTTSVTDVTADDVSPFAINHAPVIGMVTIGDTIGTGTSSSTGTGSIAPGDTLYFSVAITDADVQGSQDTINMYVCSGEADTGGVTSAFDYTANTCTGGTLICSITNVNPTTDNARCSDTTLITVPTAHQTYDVQIFIEDNHDFAGTGTNLAQYLVIDVPPVLNSTVNSSETGGDGYIEETTDPITPTAGGNQPIIFFAQISDDNGDRDITGVTAVFYDFASGVYGTSPTKSLTAAGICEGSATDENDCYVFTTGDCTLGVAGDGETTVSSAGSAGEKLFTGGDKNLQVNCTVINFFEFNANASSNWQSHVNIVDELGTVAGSSDSAAITNGALSGLDLVQTQILYQSGGGAITQGGTSDGQETSVGNVGNQVIDVLISGTDMTTTGSGGECSTDPKCIELEDQKWHSDTQNFDWDTDGVAGSVDAAWAMVASSATTSEATGCADRDLAVRAVAAATTENESVYWKIRIPAASAAGTYTGTNTFSSTSACSASFSH